MPYITKTEEELIKDGHIRTSGQRNFTITNMIIDRWMANPKYATYEEIERDFYSKPEENPELKTVMKGNPFSTEEWYRSSRCAFREFERRVISIYEDKKKADAKNVDPYVTRGVLWTNERMSPFKYGSSAATLEE